MRLGPGRGGGSGDAPVLSAPYRPRLTSRPRAPAPARRLRGLGVERARGKRGAGAAGARRGGGSGSLGAGRAAGGAGGAASAGAAGGRGRRGPSGCLRFLVWGAGQFYPRSQILGVCFLHSQTSVLMFPHLSW